MFKRPKAGSRIYAQKNAWKSYQARLRKQSARQRAVRRLPFYLVLLAALVLITEGVFLVLDWTLALSSSSGSKVLVASVQPLDRPVLRKLLSGTPLSEIARPEFRLEAGIRNYKIKTSIRPDLQKLVEDNLDKKYSRYFGLVAMEPGTGKILAMADFDKNGGKTNVCTCADFPAASLIKIVTAAAAVEEFGFNANTRVSYNGNKYHLYKSQLKPLENRYTNHITFADSFAESINPVFGKIGIYRLKKQGLEEYGKAFGFNCGISFDLPLSKSVMNIKDEPFNWAEIACGFNHQTLISPLHAALIASGVANDGRLMTPVIIEEVFQKGRSVYQADCSEFNRAFSADTAEILKRLMHETVTKGTAKGIFRGIRRSSTLSKLYIGGKTGSINENKQKIKYDWFAGFAEEKKSGKKIAVSVFVAHKNYIGTRAGSYARMIFKHYFRKKSRDSNA